MVITSPDQIEQSDQEGAHYYACGNNPRPVSHRKHEAELQRDLRRHDALAGAGRYQVLVHDVEVGLRTTKDLSLAVSVTNKSRLNV